MQKAESSAPGIHWGALDFPDQEPVLATGFSIFRFTEFNGDGERFNGIRETIGINLITTSWTRHFPILSKDEAPISPLG